MSLKWLLKQAIKGYRPPSARWGFQRIWLNLNLKQGINVILYLRTFSAKEEILQIRNIVINFIPLVFSSMFWTDWKHLWNQTSIFFVRTLVCLSSFWFVCQHFGLFASILVCLPAFWFVCQHFGLFASFFVNQIAKKQIKMPTISTIWQNKTKIYILRSASGANSHLKIHVKIKLV